MWGCLEGTGSSLLPKLTDSTYTEFPASSSRPAKRVATSMVRLGYLLQPGSMLNRLASQSW